LLPGKRHRKLERTTQLDEQQQVLAAVDADSAEADALEEESSGAGAADLDDGAQGEQSDATPAAAVERDGQQAAGQGTGDSLDGKAASPALAGAALQGGGGQAGEQGGEQGAAPDAEVAEDEEAEEEAEDDELEAEMERLEEEARAEDERFEAAEQGQQAQQAAEGTTEDGDSYEATPAGTPAVDDDTAATAADDDGAGDDEADGEAQGGDGGDGTASAPTPRQQRAFVVGPEIEAVPGQRSPYQRALKRCNTLKCLREAAKLPRYRGQHLFPGFLLIGWQASASCRWHPARRVPASSGHAWLTAALSSPLLLAACYTLGFNLYLLMTPAPTPSETKHWEPLPAVLSRRRAPPPRCSTT
jgi:hypothetical protein